jgi:DNA integrity scanning protein DisA with diadenylate cyclase activity
MRPNWTYLGVTVVLFCVEVSLALFVRDDFFRPFVGDVLVVVLIYSFLRIFWQQRSSKLVVGVCIFAFLVEFVQMFDPIGQFGLQDYTVLSVVVGRTFSWLDLVAYLVGSGVNFWLLKRFQ